MPDDKDDMASKARGIAAALAAANPGEKAEARRMDGTGSPVFWRQVARLGIPPWHEKEWLRFTRLVALMTPASRDCSIHDDKRPLGAALAEAGFSEQRLARLLAARGSAREEALERAIRMIARKSGGLRVPDLAQAIFRPEDVSHLARAFYRKLDQSPSEDTKDD